MFKRTTFFLLIFCLPFQLGYHYWFPQSYVRSFRIDYLAPTLYLTDFFIAIYLLLNFKLVVAGTRYLFSRSYGWLYFSLVIVNIFASSINPITLTAWIRVSIYVILMVVLIRTPHLSEKIRRPFTFSLVFISCLSLLQFLRRSSLGSIFYIFGERPLSLDLPNVAKLNLPWGQLLRPYATFSHPNSLAGYLLVSLAIMSLISKKDTRIKVFLIFFILLTFSKSAAIALVFIIMLETGIFQSFILGSILTLTPLLTKFIDFPIWLSRSVLTRNFFALPTLKIIINDPLFGVGLKQYIPNLSGYLSAGQISYATLQPVHQTLVLALTELGIIGLLITIVLFHSLLSRLFKHQQSRQFINKLLGIIIITGSLDHYWWTLPQNQLIIVLAISIILNRNQNSISGGKTSPGKGFKNHALS